MNILGFKMYDYNINTHSYFKLPEYDPMCACTACIICAHVETELKRLPQHCSESK